MLKYFRNRKGQNTAEYAILIALVVGGVIAMQTYAQRALQGRLRDASVSYRDSTSAIGNTLQYEPYYTNTVSNMEKTSTATDTYFDQTRNNQNIKRSTGTTDQSDYISSAVATTSQTAETGSGF
jgi:Flp pilus assembly pilin Flp